MGSFYLCVFLFLCSSFYSVCFLPEFEQLTGMKVKLVKITEAQFFTKVPADFTADTFAFDVFMSQYYDSPKYARLTTLHFAPSISAPLGVFHDSQQNTPQTNSPCNIHGIRN